MSVHEPTFQALEEMGIEPPLAREAATRFHSVEPAVNWCFGDGQSWQPSTNPLPSYATVQHGHTAEHRDRFDSSATTTSSGTSSYASTPAPALPSRPAARSAPYDPDGVFEVNFKDEEDEELQRALAMSRGEDMEVDEQRQERERSVRADAPPPSPERDLEEEDVNNALSGVAPLFGPSNKDDKDGSMAMVPVSNKEDDDLNRAIQDSLMTASFHSASAMAEEKPTPRPRMLGAPMALYSQSGHWTFGANLLQGLFAVPQIREIIMESVLPDSPDENLDVMRQILERMDNDNDINYLEVDGLIERMFGGASAQQLPPNDAAKYLKEQFQHAFRYFLSLQMPVKMSKGSYWADPDVLFSTILEPSRTASDVTFIRNGPTTTDIYGAMSDALWAADTPNQSVASFSEILTVYLIPGAGERQLWQLDEQIVLDRFLTENAASSAQTRAQQSLATANVKRLKDKLESLTTFQGQTTIENIITLIKHYDGMPTTGDAIQDQSRSEMRSKLQSILEGLTLKVQTIDEELQTEIKAASGGGFETSDPALNRHVFQLRAALFHDGALVGPKHLYAYVRDGDQWWKILDHEATKIDFETIKSDQTGFYLEAGPYILIYSRDGPRPPPAILQDSEDAAPVNQEDQPMQDSSVETSGEPVPESDKPLIDLE